MSKGSINIQQIPKSKEFLSCLIPREGCAWVDWDFAALEPTLLAELSRDESMMKLYGPAAKPNDIYIFVASQIPQLSKPFLDRGYNPDNPLPEAISLCKKECKKQRGIAKVVVLSSQYGAGPGKIHETLSLEGVDISFQEVKQIHAGYWELFQGIKAYERYLADMWRETGGYIINPIGRPLAIAEPFLKDIVNRCIAQDTLVWTHLGPVPIQQVTTSHLVWDGISWVSHGGLVFQGMKEVINLNSVDMTADHDVLINNKWEKAQNVGVGSITEVLPRFNWGTLWGLCRHISYTAAKKISQLCFRRM